MRSSPLSLALALGVCAACGNGVNDLSLEAPPIAHLRGGVNLAMVQQKAGNRPLRAALVWGAVPRYVQACLKFPNVPELQAACPDPFGFVPGQIESQVEVPLDGDGRFVIPIRRLPDASVAVGTDEGRIAWGSLIVAADLDGDGELSLIAPSEDRSTPTRIADLPVAASFVTLLGGQVRVGFREAGWNPQSLFYPAIGCEAPAQGFSILRTDGISPLGTANGGCSASGLEHSVTAAPLTVEEGRALACRTINRSSVRRPGERAPGSPRPDGEPARPDEANATQVCLDAQTLALIGEGDCPAITVIPLSGCQNSLVCQEPDWDLRDQPPGWWPCAPAN